MSLTLGMIISKEYDIDLLVYVKEKYDLGLYKINNKYVANQLLDDEIFLQATRTGFDSLTGIGAYGYYTKDSSVAYQIFNERRSADILFNELEERKETYRKDALQWIEIIRMLKCEYQIKKVGLFWHMYTSSIEEEKIEFSERVNCELKHISQEYLMKLERDVILFFD